MTVKKGSTKGVQPESEVPSGAPNAAPIGEDGQMQRPEVKSGKGRPLGRPKERAVELKAVPTRCPTQIYTYLKGITPFLYRSLTEMFEDMVKRFLAERPWDHGLHWRKPKTAMTFAKGTTGKTGWEQVNMQLPPALAEQVAATASECGVSAAALCYTAIYWWVKFIYPPEKMLGQRPK